MAKNNRPMRKSTGLRITPQVRAAAKAAGVPVSTYLARQTPTSKNLDEITRRGIHLRHSSHDKKRTIASRNPNEISTPSGGQPGWKRK